MTAVIENPDVLQQLERAISSEKLPQDAVGQARHLVQRLNSAVRVVLLGLPGSGKSQLLNLLAGHTIVPQDASWPTLELSWGQEPRSWITRDDGEVETRDGLVSALDAGSGASRLRIEMPLPVLKRFSLLEVVAGGSVDAQQTAIDRASGRADMAIWCSQGFGDVERNLWASVPDSLKDHSFFVLTKADILSANGSLAKVIAGIQDDVADEFHSLIPVATLQAIAASGLDVSERDAGATASGGKALSMAVLRQVALGRQTDMDNVALFLSRYDLATGPLDNVDQQADTSGSDAGPDISEVDTDDVDIDEVGIDEVGAQALCRFAADLLKDQASTLSEVLSDAPDDNAPGVLEHCVETANQLAEVFTRELSTDAAVLTLQGDFMEAADVVLLLQLETSSAAAADAVTVLLQLQRDLNAAIAA